MRDKLLMCQVLEFPVQFGWLYDKYDNSFFQGLKKGAINSDVLIIFVHVLSRTSLNSMRKCILQRSISHIDFGMLLNISRVSSWLNGLKWVRVAQLLDSGVYSFECWNWDLHDLIDKKVSKFICQLCLRWDIW